MFHIISTGGAIKKPLRDLVVADSQTAELECEVSNPTAEGKWLKDGQPVDFSENVVSEVNGTVRRLVIGITKATDIGEYTYQVATSKTSATLKVEGKSIFPCVCVCVSPSPTTLIAANHIGLCSCKSEEDSEESKRG